MRQACSESELEGQSQQQTCVRESEQTDNGSEHYYEAEAPAGWSHMLYG